MSETGRHLMHEFDDLLDGRLSGDARDRAQAHLAQCDRCRNAWEGLRALRGAMQRCAGAGDLPAGVSEEIRAALDREDRAGRAPSDRFPRRPALRWLAPAAAILLAIVAALLLRPRVTARVTADAVAYRAGALPLEMETDSPEKLEGFFRERGLKFRTRVLDLQMLGYRLVGGRVHSVGDRPSALFVYRGEGNKILVCQMYPGPIGELPRSAKRLEKNGIAFHVVRRGRENLVFWQEGDVTCVLVSDVPADELVGLAIAKAMRA